MSKKRPRDKPRQSVPQLSKPATETLRQIARREVSLSSTFSGPLPPPEVLIRYNDAVPDGAERIIALAERQAAHRMALESRVVDADIKRSNWGLVAGFVIALVGLVVSYLLVDRGNATAGVALGAVDLVGLVGAFVYGTVSRRGERQERAKRLSGSQSP